MNTKPKTDEQDTRGEPRAKPLRLADLLPADGRIQVIGFDTAIGADGKKVISIRKMTPMPVTDGGTETLPASAASDDLAERVAAKVVEKLREEAPRITEPEKILISKAEAAKMLGISVAALRKRVQKHQIAGVVRTSENGVIQFHRAKLLASLERKAR